MRLISMATAMLVCSLSAGGIAHSQTLPPGEARPFELAQNAAQPRLAQPRPAAPPQASPGPSPNPQRDEFVNRLNANTVTVVSGNPNGTYLTIAYDISAVLDEGDNLRVLPVVGKGGSQNVKDILYLRGVDMGITQSNILRYFNETGEVGRNIEGRLRYVARLFNEEMHVLAKPEINTLQDLRGKKVNFSDVGSGTQTTTRLIFKDLKIPVQEVNMGQADAFEAIKRGEIDATILIAGKPAGAFTRLKADPAFKIIPVPYTQELYEYYLPTTLTHEDYPQLIGKDAPVSTIAVSAVLAVFNWPANTDRYRRVQQFTEAFFKNFDQFMKSPRHPKWKEVNLAAELPGWTRFPAAQEILDREKTGSTGNDAQIRQAFEQFIAKLPDPGGQATSQARRDELFARFLEWHKSQKTAR